MADAEQGRAKADGRRGVPDALRLRGLSLDEHGVAPLCQGAVAEALAAYGSALGIARDLAEQDSTNVEFARDVVVPLFKLARAEARPWADVLAAFDGLKARGIFEPNHQYTYDFARSQATP